jgi:hypothetical protein
MFAISHYVFCEREASLLEKLMNKICALQRRWNLRIQTKMAGRDLMHEICHFHGGEPSYCGFQVNATPRPLCP